MDNICGADLTDMQLIVNYEKWIWFLLCIIDLFTKYACVVSFKYKKAFQLPKTLNESEERKPSKMWVDKGSNHGYEAIT